LTGRFLLNTADEIATKMTDFLAGLPGVEKVTPAGRCVEAAKPWVILICW